MIVRKEIDLNQPLAPAQTEMLNKLASRPITPDEDCPELTMEQLAQFRRISAAGSVQKDLCSQQRRTLQANSHAAALPSSTQTGKIPRQRIHLRSQPYS